MAATPSVNENPTNGAIAHPSDSTALIPMPERVLPTPLPIFTGSEMASALTAYRELQQALDRSMPEQIIKLDGKPFRKKGYWRAIRTAFGLSVEPISEQRVVDGAFLDGRGNFGYVVTYRATNAAGQSATGDGSCFAVEKTRRFKCPHPERPGSKRTLHFPHETCPDFNPDFQWRTLPAQATVHNVRSHAHTRAFNRAVSNLVGFGEVSAEEVDREDDRDSDQGPYAPQKPTLFKPPNFDTWLDDMRSTADEGEAALLKAWEDSPKNCRHYLRMTDLATWTAIKAHAVTVKPKADAMEPPA